MVPHEMEAGRRHEGRKLGHQVELGEQRLVATQAIGFLEAGFRAQAAALEEPYHTTTHAPRDAGHLAVARRGGAAECEIAPVIFRVDPVEGMEMGILFVIN